MNSYPSNLENLEIQRRQLEQLWRPTPSQKIKQVSGNLIRTAGQWLVHSLTAGNQLRIWTKETKQGNCWYVYNPFDGTHRQFESEELLREWLENRYHS